MIESKGVYIHICVNLWVYECLFFINECIVSKHNSNCFLILRSNIRAYTILLLWSSERVKRRRRGNVKLGPFTYPSFSLPFSPPLSLYYHSFNAFLGLGLAL